MLVIDTEQTRGAVLRTGHPRLARGLRARRSRAGPPCARDRFRRRAWHLAHHAGLERTRLFRREGDQYLSENTRQSLPGLHATYNLYSARSGVPLAQVDGDIVTVFRTAGAAALGASYLARPDAAVLLIVGSGRIAGLLAQAMRAVRPIRKVLVWNLRAAGAQALAEELRAQGYDAAATEDLEAAVRQADIVSCATLSTVPLVHGAWLQPGTHLDLIGSFKPDMIETDTACFDGTSVYVDTDEAPTRPATCWPRSRLAF